MARSPAHVLMAVVARLSTLLVSLIWLSTATATAQYHFDSWTTDNGLPQNSVRSIIQTRDGYLWLTTFDGLVRFDGVSQRTFMRPQCEDDEGGNWFLIDGLARFKDGRFTFYGKNGGLANLTINCIFKDREGTIWVGTSRGLHRLTKQVIRGYSTASGLLHREVYPILQSRNGNLWTGTSGALAQFKDGRFITYPMAEGLATNHIRTIYEDADGTFWIGTYDDGLSRFRDGRFFNYKLEHGLFDNGAFQILEDRRGYFWISCNRGIYRVSRQELNDFAEGRVPRINCVAYGKPDGLLNIECNGGRLPAGIRARDGRFWFPTQEGVAVVDPEAVYINSQAPPVLIESATLERSPVDFQGGVTIEPGQRGLEISYTGLSYIKSDQVKFKYKLEGLDANWLDAGTRRTAYYPYLPPGSYRFRVIAANSDGVWNDEGASITVIVLAPFWQRWRFWLLCATAVAGITALVIRGRIAQFKKKQAEREAFARRLIESQEGERKRIAGELHDSLGQNLLIVKNWALIGLNSLEEDNPAREHLNEISETTSLALDEVREIAHNLRPYQLERLGLSNAIEHMIRHVKNASDIEFVTEIDNVDGLLSKESEINFYRVVQECVNNVVKHSAATTAWLTIKRTASGAQITCRDDGRGFDPKASLPKRGMGLTGMAERVRMLGGRYTIESAPGKGATISITIGKIEGE
jgi:signal transduction histidine kinase